MESAQSESNQRPVDGKLEGSPHGEAANVDNEIRFLLDLKTSNFFKSSRMFIVQKDRYFNEEGISSTKVAFRHALCVLARQLPAAGSMNLTVKVAAHPIPKEMQFHLVPLSIAL